MSLASQRDMERQLHYANLKAHQNVNLVTATIRASGIQEGGVAYAKRFWHDVFQDFPELRRHFEDRAAEFGPYVDTVVFQPDYKDGIRARLAQMAAKHDDFMQLVEGQGQQGQKQGQGEKDDARGIPEVPIL